MLAHLLGTVLSLSGAAAYLVVGGLALGESAAFVGLFLPGETALLYGGVLAGRGNVSLPLLVTVAAVAAVVGDSLGYEIGRRAGRPLRSSRAGRWVGERRWGRAEQLLVRRGGPAVFLGRWVGVLRALVPTLAGMGRMPYRRFVAWNVLGGVTWASTLVVLGYAFSGSVSALVAAVTSAGLVLTAVTVAGVCLAVLARWLPGRAPKLRGALRAAVGSAPADLLVGVALVVGLVAVFALVLDGVLDGGATVALDHQALVAVSGDREPIVTGYLSAVSWLTSPVQVSVATFLIAGALSWRQRSWAVLAVAGVTLAGSGALTYLVKHLVGRPRPPVPYALTLDREPSFPSGHTLTATAMAGLLAWYVARDAGERWVRATAIGCAVGFVGLVSVSRLYLGAHWLSDVVGSVPLGLAWLVTVLLGLALAGRRPSTAGTLSPHR